MDRQSTTRKLVLLLTGCLMFSMSSVVFAANKYRVSVQFFHLGELVGAPVMEVEEGETSAEEYSVEGTGHFKFVVLVRPATDDQVSVSMQFSAGKLDIQPNLMADIGQPRSATIKKVRLNLLVEEIEKEQLKTLDSPLLTQTGKVSKTL